VFTLIFAGIVAALAMLFWVVEILRAKLGGRPPSWKQPHEPPPPTSISNAFWGNGISPTRPDRKDEPSAESESNDPTAR
jgi:hypothetical protein